MEQYSDNFRQRVRIALAAAILLSLCLIITNIYLFNIRARISVLYREFLSLEKIEDRAFFVDRSDDLSPADLEGDMRGIIKRAGDSRHIEDMLQFLVKLQKDESKQDVAGYLVFNELQLLQDHILALIEENQKIYIRVRRILFALVLTDSLLFLYIFLERRNFKAAKKLTKRNDERFMKILEQDKNMIACELHDDLAQKLAQINRYFQNPEEEKDSVDLLRRYSEDAIHQIRMVSNRLKTPCLQKINLKTAFDTLFSDFSVLSGMNLEYSLFGLNNLRISEDSFIHIYRIVQELLNNAIKHSEAGKLNMSVLYTHPELLIKYKDDGVGYDKETSMNKGLGLESIRFRMDFLKAEYLSYSTEQGVDLSIRIPVE